MAALLPSNHTPVPLEASNELVWVFCRIVRIGQGMFYVLPLPANMQEASTSGDHTIPAKLINHAWRCPMSAVCTLGPKSFLHRRVTKQTRVLALFPTENRFREGTVVAVDSVRKLAHVRFDVRPSHTMEVSRDVLCHTRSCQLGCEVRFVSLEEEENLAPLTEETVDTAGDSASGKHENSHSGQGESGLESPSVPPTKKRKLTISIRRPGAIASQQPQPQPQQSEQTPQAEPAQAEPSIPAPLPPPPPMITEEELLRIEAQKAEAARKRAEEAAKKKAVKEAKAAALLAKREEARKKKAARMEADKERRTIREQQLRLKKESELKKKEEWRQIKLERDRQKALEVVETTESGSGRHNNNSGSGSGSADHHTKNGIDNGEMNTGTGTSTLLAVKQEPVRVWESRSQRILTLRTEKHQAALVEFEERQWSRPLEEELEKSSRFARLQVAAECAPLAQAVMSERRDLHLVVEAFAPLW